jgi:hypothetical protein
MAVTTVHDFPLASRDREWDGAAAEKRIRAWADAEDKPSGKYRDALTAVADTDAAEPLLASGRRPA